PGTLPIALGTPVRFALTAGFGGGLDAKTLGYKQKDVVYQDAASGEPIAAKQHWIAVEVTANTGGKLIRRVATAIDPKTGDRHTVRQINVGHENTPNVTWVPVQIPDFMEFDPIAAGKVPAGTPTGSKEYRAAAQKLLYDYTVSQIAAVTYRPEADIRRMRMFYGPNAFTLQEKIGESARVASNGTVAGDLMGNGHFLTSGGAMTGMIGHTLCFLRYWDNLAKGVPQDVAAKILEEGIKAGSEAWLHVSQKEFSNLAPANFGKARSEALGIKESAPAAQAVQRPGFSLSSVLGNGRWEQSFQRLLAGEFGKPGVNFYVPDSEVDIRAQPNVTVQAVPVR
ncbi:MAG TPA: hypothetical protein VNI01_02155, partial [Elusimicrobiota bacterium]|nr:hypothetical protein [Elusimicrobiota bacterium]